MKIIFYQQLSILLIITAVFGVMIPTSVLATDSSVVTNIVFSSNNTGGQSLDGADGKDGKAGADGQAGKNGQSVVNTNSTTTLRITSTVNGVDVVNIEDSETFAGDTKAKVTLHTTVSSSSPISNNEELSIQSSTTDIETELFLILETILSLRLILINYVNPQL